MIEIVNLHKAFGSKKIFQGLDMTVERGETRVVIGRSGEGKSVLLKHICALMTPDEGAVYVDKKTVFLKKKHGMAKVPDTFEYVREKVSMVFQTAALFDSLNVRENVGFFHIERKTKSREEVDRLVAEFLAEVNLPNTENLLPSELSGGMRKRVGLARALATSPEIILYDEPTTGLDPVTSDVINELIIKTRNRHNVTSIVVTHDMNSAYKVADRISMLYEGRIIFTGTPSEVRHSSNPYVHQFVNGLAAGPITRREEDDVQSRASQIMEKLH